MEDLVNKFVQSKLGKFKNAVADNAIKSFMNTMPPVQAYNTIQKTYQSQPVQSFIKTQQPKITNLVQANNLKQFQAELPQRISSNRAYIESQFSQPLTRSFENQVNKIQVNDFDVPNRLGREAVKLVGSGLIDTVTGASALRGFEYLGNKKKRDQLAKEGKLSQLGAAGDVLGLIPTLPMGKLGKAVPKFSKEISLLRNKLTPDDVEIIGRFAELVETGKDKRNLGELGQTIQSLAENVFGPRSREWSNKTIKNSFDLVLQKIGTRANSAGLGLSLDNIRDGVSTNKLDSVSDLNNPALNDFIKRNNPLPWETGINTQKLSSNDVLRTQANAELIKQNNGGLNRIFNPLKTQTSDVKDAALTWDRAKKVGQIDADRIASEFKSNLDPKLEWKLVQYSQNPTPEIARTLGLNPADLSRAKDLLIKHIRYNDEIYKKANELGIPVEYRQNHIYQLFNETPEQIDNILQAKGLGSKPGFANRRTIDDFMEGMNLGLTPKYTSFGQLNAAANQALDNALANQKFTESLLKSGQLLPESKAPASWEYINARFFPKAMSGTGEGIAIQAYKAPPELASFINNLFGGQQMSAADKGLNAIANVSKGAQDLVLSGGVGPLNFFGLGQMIKEGTSGRFITPLKAFMRAYVPGMSKGYEVANNNLIREMASQGIENRGIANYQNLYKNVVTDKGFFRSLFGGDIPATYDSMRGTWNKVINEPTFGKFLNQLQIGFYEDTKKGLLQKGIGNDEAIRIAADATKRFYGLSDQLGRSKGVDDTLSAIFLAPKYRESMVNIFKEMAKGFDPRNIGKTEYAGLQKLSVGMALTYAMYNMAQKNLTGTYMWDNPPGKEFELVVPVGDPKDNKFLSVPWMPGFTAVPRRIASSVWAGAKGDVKEAVGQAGGLLSIPAGMAAELFRNKDYFGNEIIGEDNQLKDLGLYAGKKLLPGYGRAVVDVTTGKSTPAFGLIQALELPVRKGTFPNEYFTAKDEALKGLTKEEKAQAEYLFTSDKNNGPDSDMEALMILNNPKLLEIKKKVALASDPNDPLYSRSNTEIMDYLAYRATEDSAIKAQIRLRSPWIPEVQYQVSSQFYNSQQERINPSSGFNENSIQGKLGKLFNPAKPKPTETPIEMPTKSPIQMLSEEEVKVVSAYTAAPKGSATRKMLLAQNPWLRGYWDANSAYYEANPIESKGPLADYLRSIGIDPDAYNNAFAYGSSGKKITALKLSGSSPKLQLKASRKPVKLKTLRVSKTKPSSKAPKINKDQLKSLTALNSVRKYKLTIR